MCSSTLGDILDAGVSAGQAAESSVESIGDTLASVGGSAIDAAGNIVDAAGNIISGADIVPTTFSSGGQRFGIKPISFLTPTAFVPTEDTIQQAVETGGDILEQGKQEFLDPIVEDIIQPIVAAPFNAALGVVEDATQAVLGPAASVLGEAGGFYPASDQLGGIPSPVEESAPAPVQAVFDPRGADFLRDPRDRRYLNTRNTLLTGSQGVTGTPRTRRQNIFGNLRGNRLGG